VRDYHLHLWPHDDAEGPLSIEQLAAYCEQAARRGVSEIAITEHLFRFPQATDLLGPFWQEATSSDEMKASMAAYVAHHSSVDLDAYVELISSAKAQGLPVKLGLEVDYYRGHMDKVSALVDDYPFDLLLGSVHWVGNWRFDELDDALQMAEWDTRRIDTCWDLYCEALEELAATRSVDVLAHPDLIKVAGRIPAHPTEWWDRIAEATKNADLAGELSSAGWRKPVGEQYPALPLLERFLAAGVPLTTASDAHDVSFVGAQVEELEALARAAGVTHLASFDRRQRQEVAL
jgi:histidinol-phosphatase (PHP family)